MTRKVLVLGLSHIWETNAIFLSLAGTLMHTLSLSPPSDVAAGVLSYEGKSIIGLLDWGCESRTGLSRCLQSVGTHGSESWCGGFWSSSINVIVNWIARIPAAADGQMLDTAKDIPLFCRKASFETGRELNLETPTVLLRVSRIR